MDVSVAFHPIPLRSEVLKHIHGLSLEAAYTHRRARTTDLFELRPVRICGFSEELWCPKRFHCGVRFFLYHLWSFLETVTPTNTLHKTCVHTRAQGNGNSIFLQRRKTETPIGAIVHFKRKTTGFHETKGHHCSWESRLFLPFRIIFTRQMQYSARLSGFHGTKSGVCEVEISHLRVGICSLVNFVSRDLGSGRQTILWDCAN